MLPHPRMNDVPLFGKGYFFDQSSGEMINIVPTSLGSIYSRSTFFKCFFNLFDFFIRKEVQNYLSSTLQFLQLVHYFFSNLGIGCVLSRADICFVIRKLFPKIYEHILAHKKGRAFISPSSITYLLSFYTYLPILQNKFSFLNNFSF